MSIKWSSTFGRRLEHICNFCSPLLSVRRELQFKRPRVEIIMDRVLRLLFSVCVVHVVHGLSPFELNFFSKSHYSNNYDSSENLRMAKDEIVEYEYNGFQYCRGDGWTCNTVNGEKEIEFECNSMVKNARVWVWTARFPEKSTIFTVKNCDNLEVHVDCTTGSRTSYLRQFNVVNVTNLIFLKPTQPGRYLHDNFDSVALPPELRLENIRRVTLYPELFRSPDKICRNQVYLTNLTMVNVSIDKVVANLWKDLILDNMNWQRVVVQSMEPNAMSANVGKIVIANSTFPNLPSNAINFFGRQSILITDCIFRKIEIGGLGLRSSNIKFHGNNVYEVATQGLNLLGANINIMKNMFNHMDTRALERINFAYVSPGIQLVTKFVYNFNENTIRNLEPGSLHPNWMNFKSTCSQVTVEKNIFNCSCLNFGWISMPQALGPKIVSVKDFYDQYFIKEQICLQNRTCSFQNIVTRMSDICQNKTTVENICRTSPSLSPAKPEPPKPLQQTEATPTKQLPTTIKSKPIVQTIPPEVEKTIQDVEKVKEIYKQKEHSDVSMNAVPAKYSSGVGSTRAEKRGYAWFAVIPLFIILGIVLLSVWWFRRNRQQGTVTTSYKNHVENDDDNPIVINEHSNQLYN